MVKVERNEAGDVDVQLDDETLAGNQATLRLSDELAQQLLGKLAGFYLGAEIGKEINYLLHGHAPEDAPEDTPRPAVRAPKSKAKVRGFWQSIFG